MRFKQHSERKFNHFISMPFIYFMIIPVFILDICMEIYHNVCFPLYGIPLVKRNKYIKIDRQKLKYLRFAEQVSCAYCGYANGVMAYGVKIAGETEKYWCGIKHQKDEEFIEPAHHKDFLKYGDEKAYDEIIKK
ncbi:MAG: hypothetical protein ABIB43_06825 [archaeon]